jgi:signal peptidase II
MPGCASPAKKSKNNRKQNSPRLNAASAAPRVHEEPAVRPWWIRALLTLWPAAALVAFDQISKLIIERTIEPGTSVEVLGRFLVFTHQLNPAGAMSIRLGPPAFYLAVTLVVVGMLAYMLVTRTMGKTTRWALVLVLGGAVGNMIDRIRLGAVIDFVDMEFFDFSLPAIDFGPIHVPGDTMTRWPVFNVADSCVTVGIILLLLATFFFDRHETAQGTGH